MNDSMKLTVYFMAILLSGFVPVPVSAQQLPDGNALQVKYPTFLNPILQNYISNNYWQDKSLRDEFERQLLLFALADLNDDFVDDYQALKKAGYEQEWQRYESLALDLLLFYMSYSEQVASKGMNWLFGGRVGNDIGRGCKTNCVNAR
jgi:murein L,D-transpeptidase YcbB/YkuD